MLRNREILLAMCFPFRIFSQGFAIGSAFATTTPSLLILASAASAARAQPEPDLIPIPRDDPPYEIKSETPRYDEEIETIKIRVLNDEKRIVELSLSQVLSELSTDGFIIIKDGAEEENNESVWVNWIGAFACMCLAALSAGLILGLLGLDPLMLLIKERAGKDLEERQMAAQLLPLVQQKHQLLVTLLIMSAGANEALPIFLEALVPPSVAILVSVTLVLIFGEIIPSAIFTGPNQLSLAHALSPVVRAAMCLLYPLAGPIAKVLDWLLHEEDELDMYNRGELSALVRIQFEERLANKRKRKQERLEASIANQQRIERKIECKSVWPTFNNNDSPNTAFLPVLDNVGPLDFSNPVESIRRQDDLKAMMKQIERSASLSLEGSSSRFSIQPPSTSGEFSDEPFETGEQEFTEESQRSVSIHVDEITMMEGALQMNTKVALDILQPMRRVFSIPNDMCLTEQNIVDIYASGYSRIPVYQPQQQPSSRRSTNKKKRKENKSAIVGILITKQLIVVNDKDERAVNTLPLYTPPCVSPSTSLLDLLNLFQTGGYALKGGHMAGGHMALVCARPRLGNEALAAELPVPEDAGLMGICTLEDILETLLQEEIYDEMDKLTHKQDRDTLWLAVTVQRLWRRYKRRKHNAISSRFSQELQQDPTQALDDEEQQGLLSGYGEQTTTSYLSIKH